MEAEATLKEDEVRRHREAGLSLAQDRGQGMMQSLGHRLPNVTISRTQDFPLPEQ